MPGVAGVVLAAGGGRRFGGPKALARDAGGVPWVALAVDVLAAAGCADVLVVLGAEADAARALVPAAARIVVADDWASGMGASLHAGLAALADADAALLTLVDLPGLPAAACVRLLTAGSGPDVLARAVYGGRPGHPVLAGRDHWAGMRAAAVGDAGAQPYLRSADAALVECGDLWSGADVDRRP